MSNDHLSETENLTDNANIAIRRKLLRIQIFQQE